MRVLVTGGAGYIGSVTVRMLADEGFDVVVLDSLERGHVQAVDERAHLVVGNVGDPVDVQNALERCTGVIHLAGYIEVAESEKAPELYFLNNVDRPTVLLDEMARQEVHALVFSSSAAVYGEPSSVPIEEESVLLPVNVYGASKLLLEDRIRAYEANHGLNAVRLRYFNAAGAWPDGTLGEDHRPETHLIPRILKSISGGQRRFELYGNDYPTRDGTCLRDYVHVVDLARAHVRAVRAAAEGLSGAFNLGSGVGHTNLEVLTVCSQVTDTELDVVFGPRRTGDPAQLLASNARAREFLGWRPEHQDLGAIVGDAWSWHSARPDGYGPAADPGK